MKRTNYEIDMCNGPILSKLLCFTIPLIFSGILQLLFNAADVIVVGKFAGDNSLSAVGSTGSLVNLLTNFFVGLSIGANVLVAKYYGAREEKEVRDTVHVAMLVSILSGLFLTLVGLIGTRQILIWMQTPAEVLDLSALYLRIYFLGMTAMMIYNFGSAILRAIGDTKRPLYYLTFAGVINVLLNLFFVIGFRMDVAGVALATVISQCISAGLILRCLIKEQGCIHLDLRKLRFHREKFFRILCIGLPAGFPGTLFSLPNVIIQSSVNTFGKTVMAGNAAAANLEGFVYVSMNAFYQACLSFSGQNVGAGKKKRVIRILLTAEACVIVTGIAVGQLMLFFDEPLLWLYTDSSAVVQAGVVRLHIIVGTYALCGMMDVMVGALRGIGHSFLPMLVSLIGACGLRLLFIFTLFRQEEYHFILNLYLTYPVSWTVTFLAHVVCFAVLMKRELRRA